MKQPKKLKKLDTVPFEPREVRGENGHTFLRRLKFFIEHEAKLIDLEDFL